MLKRRPHGPRTLGPARRLRERRAQPRYETRGCRPEPAQGLPLDGRSDLYALGVVLFEALTGEVPYEGDTLGTILARHITAPVPAVCARNRELLPAMDGLLRTVLARRPEERFRSGNALAATLRVALGFGR